MRGWLSATARRAPELAAFLRAAWPLLALVGLLIEVDLARVALTRTVDGFEAVWTLAMLYAAYRVLPLTWLAFTTWRLAWRERRWMRNPVVTLRYARGRLRTAVFRTLVIAYFLAAGGVALVSPPVRSIEASQELFRVLSILLGSYAVYDAHEAARDWALRLRATESLPTAQIEL